MLSYQHEYHAGNHADVLKHIVWTLVIQALQRKPGALRLYDSHAGSGDYDLGSREARRNAEHEAGVARVLAATQPPADLEPWLAIVRAANLARGLRRYPGSPAIARALLRPADHLVLMELHPQALSRLRRKYGRDRQVHIHARDSFEGLPALVPPPERRGAALIDPSYEVKDDFRRVSAMLATCHQRWAGGTYVVWYPLLSERAAERFPGLVADSGIARIYRLVLQVTPDAAPGMRGSSLLIVNPPFGLPERFQALLPWLWRALSPDGSGHAHAGWLVPEVAAGTS
jgi:23S rRNA (adenine2030-N6)-methyltransferase